MGVTKTEIPAGSYATSVAAIWLVIAAVVLLGFSAGCARPTGTTEATSVPTVEATSEPTAPPQPTATSEPTATSDDLAGQWVGHFNQDQGSWRFDVSLELASDTDGIRFSGNSTWPDLDDTVARFEGQLVPDTAAESGSWESLRPNESGEDTVLLMWENVEYLSGGSVTLNSPRFARWNESEQTIDGVWFWTHDSSEPAGDFTLAKLDQ